MEKFKQQVYFNIALLLLSIFALWLSSFVEHGKFVPGIEFWSADLLFTLATTLAGVQGSRWLDGIGGNLHLWNTVSRLCTVAFLMIYGIAVPLVNEASVAKLILYCFYAFIVLMTIEYSIIYVHFCREERKRNNVSSTGRYRKNNPYKSHRKKKKVM